MDLAAELYRRSELTRYATEERVRLERMLEKAKREEAQAKQNELDARVKYMQAECAALMADDVELAA